MYTVYNYTPHAADSFINTSQDWDGGSIMTEKGPQPAFSKLGNDVKSTGTCFKVR